MSEAGIYVITNAQYSNSSTYLQHNISDEPVETNRNDSSKKYKWQLIVDGSGNKILQNRFTEQYAHIGPVPAAGDQVTGRPDSKDATSWDIIPTSHPDRFTISPVDKRLYWGLEAAAPGTPVTLREGSTNATNQWVFDLKPSGGD